MIQALATNYRRGSQDPGISINQLRFSQSIFYVYGEAARRDSYPRCARSTLGLNCAHVFRASGVQRRAPENKNRGRTSVYRERSAIGLSPALRLKNRESEAPRHKVGSQNLFPKSERPRRGEMGGVRTPQLLFTRQPLFTRAAAASAV